MIPNASGDGASWSLRTAHRSPTGGCLLGRQRSPPESSGRQKSWTARRFAVGSIRETFESYPNIGNQLPSMGYTEQQIRDLEATINGADCDLVLFSTPADLRSVLQDKQAGDQGPLRVQGPLPPVPGRHSRSEARRKGDFVMRPILLVALGGNALIRKGESGTVEEQLKNLSVPVGQIARLYYAIPRHNHSWKRPAGGATSSPAGMLQPGAEDASRNPCRADAGTDSAT